MNAFLAFPAAFVVLCLYAFMGSGISSDYKPEGIDIVKVLPYITVLLTALFGMNVTAVLTIGVALTGVIGICSGSFDVYGWFKAMGDGIIGMGELVIVTMMAAGMLELIKERGGIDFIIKMLTRHVDGKRGAELCIAALVAVVNVCTANNTVAILTVGQLSKKIGDRFGVDNRKCASILDTMSCCVQGVIPYGAQLLMAAGLAGINPIGIIPYLYYPLTIGVITILAILFRYPRRYS